MTPAHHEIHNLIMTNRLGEVLRGELCAFATPEDINDNMLPTDHAELLDKGLYPIVAEFGTAVIGATLEAALAAICVDALGVFCAHQCYYIQIVNERAGKSPFAIDRVRLAHILGQAFVAHTDALHALEIRKGDVQVDRSYKVILSGMRLLARDYGIDWNITLPAL